jgi:hypothetical protein
LNKTFSKRIRAIYSINFMKLSKVIKNFRIEIIHEIL